MRRLLFTAMAIIAISPLVAPVTAIAADIGPPTVLATPAALTAADQATQITAIHDCGTPVALAGTGSPPTAATQSNFDKYFVVQRDPERWLPAMGGGDKIAMRRSDDFLPAKPATSEKPHATTGPLRR